MERQVRFSIKDQQLAMMLTLSLFHLSKGHHLLLVTMGLAKQLLKHTIDYANLAVERTSEVLKEMARILEIEAANQ